MSVALLAFLWLMSSGLGSQAAQAPETGAITGTVRQPPVVTAVAAIDRATGKRIPGKLAGEPGRFEIAALPIGATYDVILDFQGGRLEGVNMRVPRSDYEDEQPLADEDVATISEKAQSLNKFEDVVQILALHGNIQHAVVLLNKVRTKAFYESKPGEVIWRPELWHFERPEETWVKVQDELFVTLYRDRIQKSDLDKKSVTFDSELGGLKLSTSSPQIDLGVIDPPDLKPGVRYRGIGARAVEPSRNKEPKSRPGR